jgi:hypothetical protein
LLEQLGMQARARVKRDYAVQRCTERFHNLLRSAYAC